MSPLPGDKVLNVDASLADAIVRGAKRVENRTFHTRYLGRVWIAASKRPNYPEYPCGAIVGSVEIYASVDVGELPYGYANGPVCWLLRNPVVLATPIPCQGRLGIWKWKEEYRR